MNCLRDEQIQMLIDGEFPIEDQHHADMHLHDCDTCRGRLAEQRELALSCKAAIGSLDDELTDIPGFVQTKNKKALSKKALYRIIYPLAAASILFFFLSLPFNKNNEDGPEIFGLSNVSGEIDANLPISDQEIEISFYNENGEEIN